MAQTFTVPSRAYGVGTSLWGPFAINAGVSMITVDVLRDPSLNLPGVEVLRVRAVCSFDGGVTWLATTMPSTEPGDLTTAPAMEFGMDGTPFTLDRNGNHVTSITYRTSITSPCQVKGELIVSVAATTTVTVTLT